MGYLGENHPIEWPWPGASEAGSFRQSSKQETYLGLEMMGLLFEAPQELFGTFVRVAGLLILLIEPYIIKLIFIHVKYSFE